MSQRRKHGLKLEDLPNEMLTFIIANLKTCKDVVHACNTNARLKQLCKYRGLWKTLIKKNFPKTYKRGKFFFDTVKFNAWENLYRHYSDCSYTFYDRNTISRKEETRLKKNSINSNYNKIRRFGPLSRVLKISNISYRMLNYKGYPLLTMLKDISKILHSCVNTVGVLRKLWIGYIDEYDSFLSYCIINRHNKNYIFCPIFTVSIDKKAKIGIVFKILSLEEVFAIYADFSRDIPTHKPIEERYILSLPRYSKNYSYATDKDIISLIKSIYPNAGKRWTKETEDLLLDLILQNLTIKEISQRLGRMDYSIMLQAKRLVPTYMGLRDPWKGTKLLKFIGMSKRDFINEQNRRI